MPVAVLPADDDLNTRFTQSDLARQAVRKLAETYSGRLSALRSALLAEKYSAEGGIDATLQRSLDYSVDEGEVSSLLINATQSLAIDATVERINRGLSAIYNWEMEKTKEFEGLPTSIGQRQLLVEKRMEIEWLHEQAKVAERDLEQRAVHMNANDLLENKKTIQRYQAAMREVRMIEGSLTTPDQFEFHDANILKQLVINSLGIQRKR
jgi:hypothetical protein